MLDRVVVDYFGSPTPLSQVARVGTSGSQQLVIEPFDKTLVTVIDKAIRTAGLNLNPTNDGRYVTQPSQFDYKLQFLCMDCSGTIRIVLPPLTEERRKELAKQAKSIGEDGKVAVRNIRRDAVDSIKKTEKNKEISKDDSQGFQVRNGVYVDLQY